MGADTIFVLGLSTQALMLLGEVENPATSKAEADLPGGTQN